MGRPSCGLKVVNKNQLLPVFHHYVNLLTINALTLSSRFLNILKLQLTTTKQVISLIKRLFYCNSDSSESLCFNRSPAAVEKTAVVYVFVAISRIEIQASWDSPGWSISLPWVSAKNGEERSIRGISSAQLTDLHRKHRAWEPTREPKVVPGVEIC